MLEFLQLLILLMVLVPFIWLLGYMFLREFSYKKYQVWYYVHDEEFRVVSNMTDFKEFLSKKRALKFYESLKETPRIGKLFDRVVFETLERYRKPLGGSFFYHKVIQTRSYRKLRGFRVVGESGVCDD